MAEYLEEEGRRLARWEYAQANDAEILEADPFKDEVKAAIRLAEASPEEAFARLLELAGEGSVYSMNYVAWCYSKGTGVAVDLDQAYAWYRRAYEGGSDRGLLAYGGYLVSAGRNAEAEKVYEAGWHRGFAPAVFRLIRLHLKPTLPPPERLVWRPSLEWAAGAGHPAARYLLTRYLLHGWFGARGIPRGVKLFLALLGAFLHDDENRPLIA